MLFLGICVINKQIVQMPYGKNFKPNNEKIFTISCYQVMQCLHAVGGAVSDSVRLRHKI